MTYQSSTPGSCLSPAGRMPATGVPHGQFSEILGRVVSRRNRCWLELSGLAPQRLVCEVTEHRLVETGGRTVAGMQRLRATGVQFAIDDFGTGYASMSYLRHLPVSEVKIDRQFVVDAGTDRRVGAIVRAVAGMARELDMRCVAEGIEDEQTHERALQLGADLGQGYLYARPVSADDFARHLEG